MAKNNQKAFSGKIAGMAIAFIVFAWTVYFFLPNGKPSGQSTIEQEKSNTPIVDKNSQKQVKRITSEQISKNQKDKDGLF